eukprot:6178078-Pleurochrysis_carterae.AAC.1
MSRYNGSLWVYTGMQVEINVESISQLSRQHQLSRQLTKFAFNAQHTFELLDSGSKRRVSSEVGWKEHTLYECACLSLSIVSTITSGYHIAKQPWHSKQEERICSSTIDGAAVLVHDLRLEEILLLNGKYLKVSIERCSLCQIPRTLLTFCQISRTLSFCSETNKQHQGDFRTVAKR